MYTINYATEFDNMLVRQYLSEYQFFVVASMGSMAERHV